MSQQVFSSCHSQGVNPMKRKLSRKEGGDKSKPARAFQISESAVKGERGITESQNHRIVGVGRDLCGSFSPTL